MAAYVVANYRITDPAGYEPYVPLVLPTLLAAGAEILVADYESEAMEGAAQHVTVVVRFASKSAARAWYNSAEYQSIVHHRTNHTEGSLMIVDQFVMPG